MKDKKEGIGLALSGGGYRAALFHLGGLWRLNELGWLPKLKEITSVSGGSITSAYLGLHWKELKFVKGKAENFKELIIDPLRDFYGKTIDIGCILLGILSPFHRPNDLVAAQYRKHLYGEATLQDLPGFDEGPMFTIYAASLQTGASVRFSRAYMADYHIGMIKKPTVDLGTAVAASSAFPPVLCPAKLKFDPKTWQNLEGADQFKNDKLKSKMLLADGGIYDNMGLERVWDRYDTVLVSDAGSPFKLKEDSFFIRHSLLARVLRVLHISYQLHMSLRKRVMIDYFKTNKCKGTYWGIKTHIRDYELEKAKMAPPLMKDCAETAALSRMRTRLNGFDDEEQESLINWGYALADAAMRRHIIQGNIAPGKLPY
jgi:NTE family protein